MRLVRILWDDFQRDIVTCALGVAFGVPIGHFAATAFWSAVWP